MKISIIIPNYNGENLLNKNLPRVFNSVEDLRYDIELILTDDCSTDSSIEIIEKFIKENKNNKTKIKLIQNSENKGFSSNVNRGAENAEGDLLVLLNTDVVPTKDFLSPIIPHFRDAKVFAVGCLDESIEGENMIKRGRGKGVWKRGLLMHSKASIEGKDTLWVAGGSGVFKRSLWEELGGLDSLYNPFYWEDIDLSYRARKAGYKTLFENKSIVRHEHEKGAIKTKYTEDQIKKIAYRNQFIFSWKNSDFNTLITGIFWLPYHIFKALISKDKNLITGFISALKNLPEIINRRKKNTKLFILNDVEATRLIK